MSKAMRVRAASIAMLEAQRRSTNREFYQQLSFRPTIRFFASSQQAEKKPPAIAAGGLSTDSADVVRLRQPSR
jgi:hypothetical protein